MFNKNSEKLIEKRGFNASRATQQCYLKASLYLPIGQSILALPKAYQKCVVGYWMYYQQLTLDDSCSYAVVEKKQWLLPPKSISHWCNATEVQVKILESLKNKKAPQVYKKSGADIEKFFVVWWDLK